MDSKAQPFVRKERGVDSFRRSARRGSRRGKGKSALFSVLRGVLVGASLTVLAIAALALVLNWWDASDRAITAINQVVKFVAILAAVASALDGDGASGTARGACTGALYMALGIVCYSLMMGQSPKLSGYLVDLGMGIAAGGLFGMILTGWKKG